MNILDKLIQVKESTSEIDIKKLKDALNELILYEKLARSDKFKNRKSIVWEKKTPLLFSDEYKDLVLIHIAVQIYSMIKKPIYQRDNVISAINHTFQINKYELNDFSDNNDNYFVLKDKNTYCIVEPMDTTINVYIGVLDYIYYVDVKDYTYKNVTIKQFSFVGENAYPFGLIDDEPVELLNKTLKIGDKSFEITTAEHNKLYLDKSLEYLAELIIKYKS